MMKVRQKLKFVAFAMLLSVCLAGCSRAGKPGAATAPGADTPDETLPEQTVSGEITDDESDPETPEQDDAGIRVEELDTDDSWGELILGVPKPVLQTYDLRENIDKIKVYGRSLPVSVGIACDHIASGIAFNAEVSGKISARINSNATLYYAVYVNGEKQPSRLQISKGIFDYDITGSLPKGRYEIRLINQTGVAYGRSELISLSMNGELLDAPEASEHLIEFVGDSITSGYGLASGSAPAHFDVTLGYAYQTAQLLGVDHSMVAVTGWAILPNADGSGSIPAVYDYICPWGRTQTLYQPERTADVVVINLGTNDQIARENYQSDFVPAAVEFISQVRAIHPDAAIVWAFGQMMTGAELEDFEEKINTVIETVGGEENGCYAVRLVYNQSALHGHPDAASQLQSAEILAAFIEEQQLLNRA